MAFIDDIIKNDKFKNLTEDQLKDLKEVYSNNEQIAVNEVTKRNAQRLEDEIFAITGTDKDGRKWFDYAKDELKRLKELSSSSVDVGKYKTTIAELEDKIKNNTGDEALKQKLMDKEAVIQKLQTDIPQIESRYKSQISELQNNYARTAASTELMKYTLGKTPANGISKEIADELAQTRINSFLSSYTPETIEENGKQVLQFRDSSGEILSNPNDSRRPFTPDTKGAELLGDIFQAPQKKAGAGTSPANGNGAKVTIDSLQGVKTQMDAQPIIEGFLRAEGLERGSEEYTARKNEIRESNNISELPLRNY